MVLYRFKKKYGQVIHHQFRFAFHCSILFGASHVCQDNLSSRKKKPVEVQDEEDSPAEYVPTELFGRFFWWSKAWRCLKNKMFMT